MAETNQQKTIPTLHHLSSAMSHRVLWAMEEIAGTTGLKYNLKNYSRRRSEDTKALKEIFPLGKAPIMTLETTDGSPTPTYQILPGVLTEAQLILQFISVNYTDGVWVPDSPEDKMRDQFFQQFANGTLLVKVDFVLLYEIYAAFLPFPFNKIWLFCVSPMTSRMRGDVRDAMRLMENALSEERPWFAGKKIGLADFNMCFPIDAAAQRGYFKPEDFPKIAKWHETIKNRPAYKRALEKGLAYDLKHFK